MPTAKEVLTNMAEAKERGTNESSLHVPTTEKETRASFLSIGSEHIDGSIVPPSDVPVSHRGILQKLGRRFKLWTSRYFELQGQELYYYKNERKSRCLGLVDLKTCYHIEQSNAANFGYAFEVHTAHRVHTFAARSEEDRNKWMELVKEQMGGKAIYNASLQKKTKTGRRARANRSKTIDSVPQEAFEQPTGPKESNLMVQTPEQPRRRNRLSKLVTRIASFKKNDSTVRPHSYIASESVHPPVEHKPTHAAANNKPTQEHPLQQETRTVTVEVTKPTPPEVTVSEPTPPEVTMSEPTPPEVTVSEPTPPEVTVSEPTPPEVTVSEPTPPEVTVSEPTPPEVTVRGPTPLEVTVSEPTPPEVTVSEPTHPEVTVSEPTPPEVTVRGPTPPNVITTALPNEEVEETSPAKDDVNKSTVVENEITVVSPAVEEPLSKDASTKQEDVPTTGPEDTPTTEPEDTPTIGPEDTPTTEPEDTPTVEPPVTPPKQEDVPSTKPGDTSATEPEATLTKANSVQGTVVQEHSANVVRTTPTSSPVPPIRKKKVSLAEQLPVVPTAPSLPADVRDFLSKKFAVDEIKEFLASLPDSEDINPLPKRYRSLATLEEQEDYFPSMDELRHFLAECA